MTKAIPYCAFQVKNNDLQQPKVAQGMSRLWYPKTRFKTRGQRSNIAWIFVVPAFVNKLNSTKVGSGQKKKKLPAFVFVAVQTTQFYVVLCFVDRASLYNLVNTTNLVHKIS